MEVAGSIRRSVSQPVHAPNSALPATPAFKCSRKNRRGRAWRPREGIIDADGQHMIGSGSTVRSMRAPKGSANSPIPHHVVRHFLHNAACRCAAEGHLTYRGPHSPTGLALPGATRRAASVAACGIGARWAPTRSPLDIRVQIHPAGLCKRSATRTCSATSSSSAPLAARTAILPCALGTITPDKPSS